MHSAGVNLTGDNGFTPHVQYYPVVSDLTPLYTIVAPDDICATIDPAFNATFSSMYDVTYNDFNSTFVP